MRGAQLVAAACLAIAIPSFANPVDIVIVPDPDVRITGVRVRQDDKGLQVAAHVGWIAPVIARRPDYLWVEAYREGACVVSTVKRWTAAGRHHRLPQRFFQLTLRLEGRADAVRISRVSASAPERPCVANTAND